MDAIDEYAAAMDTYHRCAVYHRAGRLVAAAVVSLQALALAQVPWREASGWYLLAFFVAYLVADFVNGLAHMWADNCPDYTSVAGPFVAAFHLHHQRPQYTKRSAGMIYFLESGSKFWLVVYLALTISVQSWVTLPGVVSFGLAAVGVISSFAEVSHYLCHAPNTGRVVALLQRMWVLLPPEHHAIHHTTDNRHYAFLCGLTDPILNWVAQRLCSGYVARADVHSGPYQGPQTANR